MASLSQHSKQYVDLRFQFRLLDCEICPEHLLPQLNRLHLFRQPRHLKLHRECLRVPDLLSPSIEHPVLFPKLRKLAVPHGEHEDQGMLFADRRRVIISLTVMMVVENLDLGLGLHPALEHSVNSYAHSLHLELLECKGVQHALPSRRVQLH